LVCALSAVALSSASAAETVSFRNDVMAAISKAGCNLGTCHGNATGKGGFKLSLRGQDPDLDFKALARDASGRRVDVFAPERSLILVKGANQIAHEGGKKLDPKAWEYQVLRNWIAAGSPLDCRVMTVRHRKSPSSLSRRPSSFWTSRRTRCRSPCKRLSPTARSATSLTMRSMSRCKTDSLM
jgi:hypothetical protein